MALEFGNRIAVGTSTTGTGTVTLGSAVSDAFMTFAEGGITDGATVHYLITEGNDFEIGTGTYTSSGTTLSRDTVIDSKISGTAGTTKMTLGGSAEVRVIADASDFGGGGGGLVWLASTDLSGDATANFTAFDAGSYDAYLFVLQNVVLATHNVALLMRTTTDGGSNWDNGASDYSYAANENITSGTSSGVGSAGATAIQIARNPSSNTGYDGVSGHVWVVGPHLAKKTAIKFCVYYENSAGFGVASTGGGQRLSSADVDGAQFLAASGNLESGTITMYGLVNA